MKRKRIKKEQKKHKCYECGELKCEDQYLWDVVEDWYTEGIPLVCKGCGSIPSHNRPDVPNNQYCSICQNDLMMNEKKYVVLRQEMAWVYCDPCYNGIDRDWYTKDFEEQFIERIEDEVTMGHTCGACEL